MEILNHSFTKYRKYLQLADPEHLEAPDMSFIGHRDILIRNRARYEFVKPFVTGHLLDIGCGRGYGFDVVQDAAESCTGVDVAPAFLREAHERYPSIALLEAMGNKLPFQDKSFDTIISFEVIEHIEEDADFLQEIARISRPGALIAISTPNRIISSGNSATPLNKFHVREYIAGDFMRLLNSVFTQIEIFGQYEAQSAAQHSSIADRIPIDWKYRLPLHVQSVLSVMVRHPLTLQDCYFSSEFVETAHTLFAICRIT
jgi:ubiquinone/menaquinone biosynthesis C-methylase UbiE